MRRWRRENNKIEEEERNKRKTKNEEGRGK